MFLNLDDALFHLEDSRDDCTVVATVALHRVKDAVMDLFPFGVSWEATMTAAPTLDSVCLTAADDGFLDLDGSGLEVLGDVMEFSSVLVLHSAFPFVQTIVFCLRR